MAGNIKAAQEGKKRENEIKEKIVKFCKEKQYFYHNFVDAYRVGFHTVRVKAPCDIMIMRNTPGNKAFLIEIKFTDETSDAFSLTALSDEQKKHFDKSIEEGWPYYLLIRSEFMKKYLFLTSQTYMELLGQFASRKNSTHMRYEKLEPYMVESLDDICNTISQLV